jgi:hypothetical protein
MDETRSDNESIACPACGERISDLWDYGWHHETIEDECPAGCGATIVITRTVHVSYRAVVARPL